MRGLMFNYLLEYLEETHSYALVDNLIESSALRNDGSYADGGLYPDEELLRLVDTASNKLKVKPDSFLEEWGEWIFSPIFDKLNRIYENEAYRQSMIQNAFDFIVMLNAIHYKEVAKLYPDSKFPHFKILKRCENELQLEYRSDRKLHHLAKGMLVGCGKYFKETFRIHMVSSPTDSAVIFTITKASE